MMRMKTMAALAAGMLTLMGCGGAEELQSEQTTDLAVSRAALTLPTLPPTPAMQRGRTWSPGQGILPTSLNPQSAFLVLKKNPDYPTKFIAWGFDPLSRTNLFVISANRSDYSSFMHQWGIDADAWRTSRMVLDSEIGVVDGIGGGPPAPTPTLRDDVAWKHAYYAYEMQKQIGDGL